MLRDVAHELAYGATRRLAVENARDRAGHSRACPHRTSNRRYRAVSDGRLESAVVCVDCEDELEPWR